VQRLRSRAHGLLCCRLECATSNAALATDDAALQMTALHLHGTGTALGDPIEAGAAAAVLLSGRAAADAGRPEPRLALVAHKAAVGHGGRRGRGGAGRRAGGAGGWSAAAHPAPAVCARLLIRPRASMAACRVTCTPDMLLLTRLSLSRTFFIQKLFMHALGRLRPCSGLPRAQAPLWPCGKGARGARVAGRNVSPMVSTSLSGKGERAAVLPRQPCGHAPAPLLGKAVAGVSAFAFQVTLVPLG